jgi:hypothetical protein
MTRSRVGTLDDPAFVLRTPDLLGLCSGEVVEVFMEVLATTIIGIPIIEDRAS